jgi:hypothetical protein
VPALAVDQFKPRLFSGDILTILPNMSPTTSLKNDSTSDERPAVAFVESTSWLAKVHPYFKDPSHVLVLKLDVLLLVWAFIAGLFKVTSHTHFNLTN